MSRLDDFIKQLCPNGVEFRPLGDFSELVRGNGMPRSDFVPSGVGCIHYGQIYTHYGVWAERTLSFVEPEKAARLATVQPGDIVITNTSENIEDVCKAVAWLGDAPIVTGGHATVIKHSQDPKFLSYYFRTQQFFDAKRKLAVGAKVIDVSAKSLAKIRVPLPPLPVQREVVRILDGFTKLEAELEAELQARRKQYQHYRDSLLDFSRPLARREVRWITLGELGSLFGGLTGKSKQDFANGNATFVSYLNVHSNIRTNTSPLERVRIGPGESQNAVRRGDILFTGSSETADDVGVSSVVTNEPPEALFLNSFCFGLRLADPELFDVEFSKHLFRSAALRTQIVRTASGVTRFNISKEKFRKIRVPVPPIAEQRRIAQILDHFDTLVNDLSIGLPAELKARRQQYEHYLERLLSFPEAA